MPSASGSTDGGGMRELRGGRRGWLGAVGRRRFLRLAAIAGALIVIAVPGSQRADAGAERTRTYIVQTTLDPVAAYEGGVRGLGATEPGVGQKIDPGSADVVAYAEHLKARHGAVLARAGGGERLYDYFYAFDGFAARLTETQAAKLAAMPEVVAVTEDELHTTDTATTPSFLGLDARGGLWDRLGGPTGWKKHGGAGDDVVVGVIDSGIWPDSRSFADRDAHGRRTYERLRSFHGRCESAEKVGDDSWDANLCNRKLIAARHFSAGWGGDAAVEAQRPWEFLSPRDYNGHGTHTASTAAGNHGLVPLGPSVPLGRISGMAPRARIAAYKALWSTQNGSSAGGYASDIVAAIDQAVADGVDVINFSISGTSTDFLDPVEVAFLFAADAGVFVSAAAGNSGPASGTVAHPSPWVTTVAAGTHDRKAHGSVTLGSGVTYEGASLASKVGPAPLLDSTAAGLPGADSWQAERCYPASGGGGTPVLDRAKVAGKIVICAWGDIPPVDKSRAVKEAGGVGMILANTSPAPVSADLHFVPTVHLSDADGAAVKAYAASPDARASINAATIGTDAPAPHTASFSSRGPLAAGSGDLLKPELIAPGQDILAAIAPPARHGRSFDLASGTSMAAPHVAGLAALLKDLRPTWSPMAIKSALMTTGSDVLDGPATDPAVIFSQGAGHVRPNRAADPGLVYDSGLEDWLAFLCGATNGVEPRACDALADDGYSFETSDLNTAAIAINRMRDAETVTREVTNVGRRTATYRATTTGLDGISATVSPRSLTLKPGTSKSFTVAFTRTSAVPNRYYGGHLTWTDGIHTVRTPIVVHPARTAEDRWVVRGMHGGPTFDAKTQTGYVQPQLRGRRPRRRHRLRGRRAELARQPGGAVGRRRLGRARRARHRGRRRLLVLRVRHRARRHGRRERLQVRRRRLRSREPAGAVGCRLQHRRRAREPRDGSRRDVVR
jgi:subtilisin family serine protease